jgi:hypothetical protein
LVDGADVYETDNAIREILLSLDEDGDTSNGITINATIVEALATAGITSLPTNTTEMDALKSVIESNGGTVVSEIDAQAHFLKSLFGGKTFNIVENWEIIQWVFDATVTEVNVMVNGAVADGGGTWIDGDKLYRATDHYYMVDDVTAEYALIGNYYQSAPVTYIKFYFDEAKAQADLDSRATPMTTAMLSGKVFYTDGGDNFEQISFISPSEVIFREILIAQDGSILFDTGSNASPYIINASGEVVITFSDGGTNTYKLVDTTATQWNMVKNGDANSPYSTWLLTAPNGFPELNTTPDTITTEADLRALLAGKSLYSEGYVKYTFNDTVTSLHKIDVDAGSLSNGSTRNIILSGSTITEYKDDGTVHDVGTLKIYDKYITLTWASGFPSANLWYNLSELEALLVERGLL